jgi:hypothetical protein
MKNYILLVVLFLSLSLTVYLFFMVKSQSVIIDNAIFTFPSISSQKTDAIVVKPNADQVGSTISIYPIELRQYEFLKKDKINFVLAEFRKIKSKVEPCKQIINNDIFYSQVYVREISDYPDLNIDVEEFKLLFPNIKPGVLNFRTENNRSFQAQIYVLSTANTHFFIGGYKNGQHVSTGIPSLASVEDVRKVLRKFDLIFVDWKNMTILQ